MNSLTIKQLRYFEAVALHKNFGRAAEACSISQPAISVQIRELETTLGGILFERGARHVYLTAFGEEVAVRSRAILQATDDLVDLKRSTSDQFSGELRLGIIPTIAPYLLPKIVAKISTRFPDLDIRVRETTTDNLIDDLRSGRLDTALLALPVSDPALVELPLFEEAFVLVRPKSQANDPVPDHSSLREMRLLLLEEGHCFRDQALSFCGVKSNAPREGMDGSTLSTLVQMVGAGIGITLIPEMAVPIETRSADVSVAKFIDAKPARTVGLVWRKTSPMTEQFHEIGLLFGIF